MMYAYILKKLLVQNRKVGIYAILMIIVGLVHIVDVLFPKVLLSALMAEPISLSAVSAIIGCFFVVSTLARASQTFFTNRNNVYLTNLSFYLKEDIQQKCMTMDYPYTEDKDTLNLIQNANHCAQQSKTIVESFCAIVSSAIVLLFYSGMILHLNAVLLSVVVLNLILSSRSLSKAKRFEADMRNPRADQKRRKDYLFRTMFDYHFGKEIRIFSMQKILAEKFTAEKNKFSALKSKTESNMLKFRVADGLLTLCREGFVYALLIYYYFAGTVTLDDFVLYLGIAASFSTVAQVIVEKTGALIEQKPYIADYRTFVEGEFEQKKNRAGNAPSPEAPVNIEFVHVSFRYPHSDRLVLDDVSFTISSGSHVSLVGLNGAGKSTIVKLLCRFYEPVEGAILLNGVDIRSYNQEQYTKLISGVFQDSKLFAFTLAENISLDAENMDREKIWGILDRLGMKSAVEKLERKEDANVQKNLYDDGVEFSGGEIQRLCIARAMYKEAGLLLLDEPTAALDALAEKRIYENFSSLSQGMTTLFISHRLNSNRLSDRVIFLDSGRIAAQGTHEELMESCGMYRELYHMQARFYVDSEKVSV